MAYAMRVGCCSSVFSSAIEVLHATGLGGVDKGADQGETSQHLPHD